MTYISNNLSDKTVSYKRPLLMDYADYKTEKDYDNKNKICLECLLEDSPEEDEFCGYDKSELLAYTNPKLVAKAKIPPAKDTIATMVLAMEALRVINSAIKDGCNVYEAITNWINGNRDMSDKDKVNALKVGAAMAKGYSINEVA